MGLKWVPVDAYHMPELPAELKVDPILAALLHMACFMELSAEKTVVSTNRSRRWKPWGIIYSV